MNYRHVAQLFALGGLACSLFGCGTTTQVTSALGTPATPGGSPTGRLDFLVDNNQASTQSNVAGQTNTGKVNQIKSFISVQIQNSSNTVVNFQYTDYQIKDGQPVYSNGYVLLPTGTNEPFVYYDTVKTPTAQVQNLWNAMGKFEIATFTYTPPAKIVTDEFRFPGQHVPLDTFALNAVPDNPNFPAHALLIHLNLTIAIAPIGATIPINTASTNSAGAPTQNTQLFTATIPGDGVRAPYDPNVSGSGQVKWAFAKKNVDGSGNITYVTPASGSIDPTSGLFTAPMEAGVYTITAQSLTQPDKSTSVDITVAQQGTTVHFR